MSDLTSNFDLFNLPTNEIIREEKKGDYELYKPSAKDGKDNSYKSVLKFLPWHKDITRSVMNKWTVWLVNSELDQSRMIDCPSTIKQPSILQQVFFDLRNSSSASEKELASNFGRREVFHSLVQIIKDPNEPSNEGKIKVFRYGRKIYDKIKATANPEEGMDMEANNPFDIFKGRPFMLNIKIVAGYNNYDDSYFLSKEAPLLIDGVPVENKKENYDKVREFLIENSPDLSKYDFHPWDDDTKAFVINTIKSVVPPGKILEKIFKKGSSTGIPVVDKTNNINGNKTKQTATEKLKISINRIEDDLDADDIETPDDEIDVYLDTKKQNKSTKAPANKTKIAEPVEIDEEELDLYGDL